MPPPKKIAWVTGASGFIGAHVRHHFLAEGWSVVGLDRRRAPGTDKPTLMADIDDHSLGAAYDMVGPPMAVFHGAGAGSVAQAAADPAGSKRDTVASTRTLLDFLHREAPRCRVVFPSSAAVYGAVDGQLIAEDRPLAPISPYGEQKRAAEDLCLAAAKRGQPITIFRMFSVYGPGLRKQLPWDLGRKLMTTTGPTELFGTGEETRDFLAVEDAAGMIVALADVDPPSPLIVNGGTGKATTVATFAKMLAEALGVTHEIGFNGQERPGDPKHYCADVTRLKDIGMGARVTLAEGLSAYAAWLKAIPAKT